MKLRDLACQVLFAYRSERSLVFLVVVAIGVGIGCSMGMVAVIRAMSADPVPHLSSALFVPRFDASPPAFASASQYNPLQALTWPDARMLLQRDSRVLQAASAGSRVIVRPADGLPPFRARGRLATWQFFATFQTPFSKGAGWQAADDENGSPVVVLNGRLAQKLFGTTSPLGKLVHLEDHAFTIIGVLDDWMPRPLFYADIEGDAAFSVTDEYFIPLTTALRFDMAQGGGMTCWSRDSRRTSDGCAWVQVWLQLPDSDDRQRYADMLGAFWREQLARGRNSPDAPARLATFNERMRAQSLVPSDIRLQFWLAFGLLAICIANTSALLMAKTHRRARELQIRRALGASLWKLRGQMCLEATGIGAAIAIVGTGSTLLTIALLRHRDAGYADLLKFDGPLVAGVVVLAIVAAMLATLAPSLIVGRLALASHLQAPE